MKAREFAAYSDNVKFELCINNEWFDCTRADILKDADLGTRDVDYWTASSVNERLIYAQLGPSDSELEAV